jgi:hypothetical protein
MLGKRLSLVLAAIATAASLIATVAPVAARSDAPISPSFTNPAQRSDWRQFHGAADHRGWNQSETTLSVSNVAGLQVLWRAAQGFNSSPAVANGVVYVADYGVFSSILSAYPADCATDGSYCAPLWIAHPGYADWASPAVAGGMVYMQTDSGLSVYQVGCRSDGGECSPIWTGTDAASAYTSPTVANGLLFVATKNGELQAYDTQACAAAGGVCAPMWTADLFGSEPMSTPTVSKGVVYIVGNDGVLYAFGTRCATGGAACSAIWMADVHAQSHSAPAVANGVVYVTTWPGELYAFKVGCSTAGGTCSPTWYATTGLHFQSGAAVTDDMVYVATESRLYAFAVGCGTNGGQCQPVWRSHKGGPGTYFNAGSPAVANGVVYVTTQGKYQQNGRLLAFKAYCHRADGICTAIYKSPLLGGMVNTSPAVAHGMVYVASNYGTTYAFGLPPTP